MRRDVRASLLALGFFFISAYLLVFHPLAREHAKANVRRSLEFAARSNDPIFVAATARSVLWDLRGYRHPIQTDVETQIDRAAAYMLLRNYPDAVTEYQRALRLEKRPEIYFNLGEAQVASGESEAGIESLTRAVLFDPRLRHEITDGLSRQRTEDAILAIQKRGGPCQGAR